MSRKDVHRLIFRFSLLLLVCGIPFCRPLMSMGLLLLAVNWIAEGNFREKGKRIRRTPLLWVCLLLFAVHLAGLCYSENLGYAANDLIIKIPLFALPLIFATTEALDQREYTALLQIYLFAVCASVCIGTLHFLRHPEITDKREIALYISYIRLGLNLSFGSFVSLHFLHAEKQGRRRKGIFLLYLTALAYLVCMMCYIGALTALTLTGTGLLVFTVIFSLRQQNKFTRLLIPILLLAAGLIGGLRLRNDIREYTRAEPLENADRLTALGHPYTDTLCKEYIENGTYVYSYLCEEELETAWKQRSSMGYNDWTADGGHIVRYVLIRYLNSKGLRKDAEGVRALNDADIRAIESGKANVHYTASGLEARYYETLWDLSLYFRCHEMGGSVPQRFEVWRISLMQISEHPLFGTGTGDVKDAFGQKLETEDSPANGILVRSHNQYLSFAIAFGWIGLAICLFSLLYPPFATRKKRNSLYLAFLLIFLLSMFTDDPLERQDGVTLFAFFNSLFLFLLPEGGKEEPHIQK